MNFFGHAVVARTQCEDASFVLGAMLPDLCSMAGIRLATQSDALIARGVALHHETDRRFHAAPAFRALCASALYTLEAQGVGRGAARAVGHLGSELLLDGKLSEDAPASALYKRTLTEAIETGLAHRVCSTNDEHAARLLEVLTRLAGAPLPEGYRDPDFVYQRVERILARRPRLALQPKDRAAARTWLQQAVSSVDNAADELLRVANSS